MTSAAWKARQIHMRTTGVIRALIALTLLLSPLANALPFLGPEKDFKLRFAENANIDSELKDLISDELMNQKETNSVLKQYSSQHKIDRYQADTVKRLLRAEGYYGSDVGHRRQGGTTFYLIDPGKRYRVTDIRIDFPPGIAAPDPQLLDLKVNDPLRAELVLDGRNTVIDWVYLNLCLYQVQVDYEAVIYHQDQTAAVTYTLAPSAEVEFGRLDVTGTETVEADYLRARLPVQTGGCFNRHHIDQARLTLLQTNLVSSVQAQVAEPVDGQAAVTFNIEERRHRTFRAGIGYDMDVGAGVTTGWEHRNLLGRGENLDISAGINEIGYLLESEFIVPHFRRPHQSLVLHANLLREKPDAYETDSGSVGAALTRQVTRELFGSLGVKLRYSQVLEDEIENDFFLLSMPFTLEYDKRDQLLNPQGGWQASLALEPFTDIQQTGRRFIKSRISASAFHTQEGWPGDPTFAAKIALGTISGVQRQQVPADLRFYVGGGGSVRGYGYQSLGDLTDGDPDGGRSFTEVAFETRIRFSKSWGGVVFLDGGYAYPEELPSLGEDLLWGTGLGIRYLTDFAPIRFDVAVPLNRRSGVDDAFQIYVSIGQAF